MHILAFAALIVYILNGFDGGLSKDVAIYSYGAQKVVDGVPPYLGILNRAGPLAHLIPAIGVAGARVAGFEDVLGMRLLFMLFAIASVCVTYVLGRELLESRLAGLAASSALLSFQGFITYATTGPREKTPMVFFLLCCWLGIAKRKWFAAGASISLAALLWQPALLVGLAAFGVTVVAMRSGERTPALVRFTVGGLVPAALCTIYFAAVGALREFVDAYLLINARYTVPSPLWEANLANRWAAMQRGYGVTLWAIVVGLAALFTLALVAIRRKGWRASARTSEVVLGAAALVGLGWSVRDFNSWPDAFVLLPLAALGVGAVTRELARRLPPTAALAVTLTWVVAALVLAVMFSVTNQSHGLDKQRRAVEAMLAQLPPGASILSIEAAQPLVLSRSTNPTRHQSFSRGLENYVDDTWPGGLAGFANWVRQERPTVISMGSARKHPWLRETLDAEYRWKGRAPKWVWFVHRSVASDVTRARR